MDMPLFWRKSYCLGGKQEPDLCLLVNSHTKSLPMSEAQVRLARTAAALRLALKMLRLEGGFHQYQTLQRN